MRALLERSRSVRCGVAALAAVAVVALVHTASAGDDLGLRRATFMAEPQAVAVPFSVDAAVPILRHRHARRIWAAAGTRPLRIALRRTTLRARIAARQTTRPKLASRVRAADPQVTLAKLLILPPPPRPTLVSIYQDRTLRNGDAVMLADGIHVFRGLGAWPHRPRDFVRLTLVASLDWHLRQTLTDLDRNPPLRWSSLGSTSG